MAGNTPFYNQLFLFNITVVKFIHVASQSFSYFHGCVVFHFIKLAQFFHRFSYLWLVSSISQYYYQVCLRIFFHVSLWTCQFLQGVTSQPSPISSSYTLGVVAKWFSKVVIWIYISPHNVFEVLLLHIFTNACVTKFQNPFPI